MYVTTSDMSNQIHNITIWNWFSFALQGVDKITPQNIPNQIFKSYCQSESNKINISGIYSSLIIYSVEEWLASKWLNID
jgi:hypothetical protein